MKNTLRTLAFFIAFLIARNTHAQTYAWSNRYSSTDNDIAIDVSLDNTGNVHFAGIQKTPGAFKLVTRYVSSSGVLQWTHIGNANLPGEIMYLKRDAAFNTVVICLVSPGNYQLIKYNVSGIREWQLNLTGTPLGLATEGTTKIYVGFQTAAGFVANCYASSNATILWTKTDALGINGRGFAVDRNGNVYIGGQHNSTSVNKNLRLTRFSSTATPYVWSTVYSIGSGEDDVQLLSVDDFGNVYTIGKIDAFSTSDYIFLSKYNSSGVFQWSKEVGAMGGFGDPIHPHNIIFDSQKNPIVAGDIFIQSMGAVVFNTFFIMRYDKTNGAIVYAKFPNYIGTPVFESYKSCTIDQFDNIYLTGLRRINDNTNVSRWMVTKVSNVSGNKIWSLYSSSSGVGDAVNSIVVNSLGDIYLNASETYVSTDMVLRKYTQANIGQRLHPVKTEKQFSVSVFPNPFVERCTLKIPTEQAQEGFSVIVSDLSGKVFLNDQTNAEEYSFELEAPAGVYFVTIISGGARKTTRIVKMEN
jgi:hypothetical protein